MITAAQEALRTSVSMHAPSSGNHELLVLKSTPAVSLVGYADGAFAVVAADDMFPAILGVSYTKYSEGGNPNFEFWLSSMTDALIYRVEHNMPSKIIAPDPNVYPVEVEPMLATQWDQLTPYNRLLPTGIYTGCVATAMAQVLNYHKYPDHGLGSRTIYAKGTPVTANFEEDFYDWDNMLDLYIPGQYSDQEADAVALLMRDCGVAANMEYGTAFEGGSGAYSQDAAEGLRTYFGIPDAKCLDRSHYSEAEWMDFVFNELSTVGPLYYGGTDMAHFAGHAFVLHGYREDGMVYVNWGWSGDDDGYYDISLLNPPGYKFSSQQDMIIGVHGDGPKIEKIDTTLVAREGGELAQQLDSLKERVVGLKVIGHVNSTDMRLIRWMAGIDENLGRTKGRLQRLDLSEAQIVEGGEAYLIDNDTKLTTNKHVISSRLFYGCSNLRSLSLPSDILSIETGAFGLCPSLREIDIPISDEQTFVIKDKTIYPKNDTCRIQEVLPSFKGPYIIEKTINAIDDYAFAGCAAVSSIDIPSTVTSIGKYAFENCNTLSFIRIAQYEVPQTGYGALEGVDFRRCKLKVPAGSKEKYKRSPIWGIFVGGSGASSYDNIVEFGSAIIARNAGRFYGDENPTLGYSISGDIPNGTPELTCEADIYSSVGDYTIHVTPGTITDEIVQYFDGVLHVWPAPLTVSVNDYTRMEGEENPEFSLKYEGFKLGEGMEVIHTLPMASCEADASSPAGSYTINISGGEADNYFFKYVLGTLTIEPDPTGIREIESSASGSVVVYTIDGRRVAANSLNELAKGIYVVNGKKVTIK